MRLGGFEGERNGPSCRWFCVTSFLGLRPLTLVAIGALALSACEAGTASRPAPQDQPSPEAPKTAAEAPAEPSYTVDVEVPPDAKRGQEAIARVRVQPKAPWHINLEYPAKLRLRSSDAVELDTTLLRKDDAERFDDEALVFSVLFTPQAKGPQSIAAEVDFAVCGDAACGPVTEAVQLAFDVGCREEDTGLC